MTILNQAVRLALIVTLSPALAQAGGKVVSAPMPPPKPPALPNASAIAASIAEELPSEPDAAFPNGRASRDESRALASFGNDGWRTRFEGDLTRRDHGVALIPDGSGQFFLPGTNPLDEASLAGSHEGQTFSGLANVWMDLAPSGPVTPYVGGGIGAAHVSREDVGREGREPADDSDLILAWQVGAGIGWDIQPNWSMSVDYRWFNAEGPNSEVSPAKNAVDLDDVHELFAAMHLMF